MKTELTVTVVCVFMLARFPLLVAQSDKERCNKNRNTRWVDGKCEDCPKCPQGFGLSKTCGYGAGVGAECTRCEKRVTFNTGADQKCVPCLDCSLYHRHTEDKCRPEINAECGKCWDNYFDPSYGSYDEGSQVCSHCKFGQNHPQCAQPMSSTTVTPPTGNTAESAQGQSPVMMYLLYACTGLSVLEAIALMIFIPLCVSQHRKLKNLQCILRLIGSQTSAFYKKTETHEPEEDTSAEQDSGRRQDDPDQTSVKLSVDGAALHSSENVPLMGMVNAPKAQDEIRVREKEHERHLGAVPDYGEILPAAMPGACYMPEPDCRTNRPPVQMNEDDRERYQRALVLAQGKPVAVLDLAVKESIALHLSERCSGVGKNFHRVAEKFGIDLILNQNLKSMEDLFKLLCQKAKKINELLEIVNDLERYDVVNILAKWVLDNIQPAEREAAATVTTVCENETGDQKKTFLFSPANEDHQIV